jgi:dipeptidyl aminopeptidase/acylaminoacyl peptidase
VQATGLDGQVDGSRIALWGVSYAGGHVLVTAAKFGSNISAVIANVSWTLQGRLAAAVV